MVTRLVLALLACIAAAGLLSGWYVLPSAVEQHVATRRMLAREITGPGILTAGEQVTVTARIQAFLASVEADRNDRVREGQVLATLEAAELKHQLAAAAANANAARDAIREAEAGLVRLEIAHRRASEDLERRGALLERKSISRAEFEQAEAAQKQAEAEMLRGRVTVERTKAQAEAAAAEVKLIESRVEETTIRSPLSGVVLSRSRTVGDLLSPGAELMQVADPASLLISARFDESTMASIRPGQAARVTFSSDPATAHEASVARIGRQVDQETREFTVDIRLAAVPRNWAVGQRASVTIQAESPSEGISVPQRFLARRDGRVGLWIARNGRARWAPVSLGYASGSDIEVTRGLEAGDVVLEPAGRYWLQPVARGQRPA